MIGFGSIGKGTLPLIERHFDYDKSRFVIIDPHEDGELAKQHGVRFIKQAHHQGQLSRGAGAAADRRRRPGLLRQSVGRHLLGRYHDAVPRDRRALYRHRRGAVARLLFRQEYRPRKALELRPARDAAGGQAQEPGRPDRGFHLRRQSRHGVVVRQAGAARYRPRHQYAVQRAEEPRRLGPARPQARRQGHPYRRARHPALEEAEADERVRQHLVGGRFCLRGHAAGRTRLGHP